MKTNFLDTNIFIYYFQNTSEVVKLFKQIKNNNEIIFFSFVSKIEMLGVPGISEEELIKIENFLNEFICIDYNKEIEKLTIDIRKQKSVKIPDAI